MTEQQAADVPATEAGRRWLDDRERYESWHPVDGRRDRTLQAILAIEREAAAAQVERLTEDADLARYRGVTSGSSGLLSSEAGSTPADATGLGSSKEHHSPLDPGRTNLVVENDNGSWTVARRGYSPFATFDSEEDARFYVQLMESLRDESAEARVRWVMGEEV